MFCSHALKIKKYILTYQLSHLYISLVYYWQLKCVYQLLLIATKMFDIFCVTPMSILDSNILFYIYMCILYHIYICVCVCTHCAIKGNLTVVEFPFIVTFRANLSLRRPTPPQSSSVVEPLVV